MSREELRVEIASRALGLGGEFFHNYGPICDDPVSIVKACFDIADQFMASLPPMDDGGWISTMERSAPRGMPVEVLICSPKGFGYWGTANATHWRPLPELPALTRRQT